MTIAAHAAVAEEVRARGGVVAVSALIRGGLTRHRVRAALAAGALRRVRRGWVAHPDADPQLINAARHGVTLTCVTQAARLGLWVLEKDRPHVGADPHATGSKPRGVKVHWARPLVPRPPGALCDSIENVLALVATCQPHDAALAVFESAFHQGMIDRGQFSRLALPASTRRLLEESTSHADSGLETLFLTRLRWLRERILPQVWIAGSPVDFLVGERLVVQIDGGHHVDAQRTRDIAHDATLMLLGYHVIRIGYDQIVNDWPGVQELILRAIAQGLHRAA